MDTLKIGFKAAFQTVLRIRIRGPVLICPLDPDPHYRFFLDLRSKPYLWDLLNDFRVKIRVLNFFVNFLNFFLYMFCEIYC